MQSLTFNLRAVFSQKLTSFLPLNAGIPVEDRVNIFINSFGSIQETTMVRICSILLQQDLQKSILSI